MTVIAYRDGIMSCDTMASWSGDVNYGHCKIGATRHFVMGFAGSFAYARAMYDWIESLDCDPTQMPDPFKFYKSGDNLPDIHDLSTLLVERGSRKMWAVMSSGLVAPIHGEYEAMGSGGRFALGAMHAGATAMGAAKAAIHHDEGCGGEVLLVGLKDAVIQPPFEA